MESKLLSITEYCAKYGKDGGNVRRLLASGRIKGYKVGNQWVIPEDEAPPPDRRRRENKEERLN